MKATIHIGRLKGKTSARHNDRTFDTSKNESITKPENAEQNSYFIFTENGKMRNVKANRNYFESMEKDFYKEHFSESLEKKNQAYRKKGHPEDVKNINQVRRGIKSAPTEIILQVGKEDEYQSRENFEKMVKAWVTETQEKYPNLNFLNAAIHWDEAAGHAHIRGVFIGHTKEGLEEPNQTKALREMGIERPDLSKGNSKNNNEMVNFTEQLRESWYQTIEKIEPEIEIDREVVNPSQKHKSLMEHKVEQLKKQTEEMAGRLKEASTALAFANENIKDFERKKEQMLNEFEEEASKMQMPEPLADSLVEAFEQVAVEAFEACKSGESQATAVQRALRHTQKPLEALQSHESSFMERFKDMVSEWRKKRTEEVKMGFKAKEIKEEVLDRLTEKDFEVYPNREGELSEKSLGILQSAVVRECKKLPAYHELSKDKKEQVVSKAVGEFAKQAKKKKRTEIKEQKFEATCKQIYQVCVWAVQMVRQIEELEEEAGYER